MNVDVSKTEAYYHSLTKSSLCDCAYCRNFRLQVRSAFPQVARYFSAMGIDIEKPFETSPLEPDEDGMLAYCGCQYIVFGNCEPEYRYSMDNMEFRLATSYPATGIAQEHFLLEWFPVWLKYIL